MLEIVVAFRDIVLAILLAWVGVDYDEKTKQDTESANKSAAVYLDMDRRLETIIPASFEPACEYKDTLIVS